EIVRNLGLALHAHERLGPSGIATSLLPHGAFQHPDVGAGLHGTRRSRKARDAASYDEHVEVLQPLHLSRSDLRTVWIYELTVLPSRLFRAVALRLSRPPDDDAAAAGADGGGGAEASKPP